MPNPLAILELQNLVARFANSFDLKEWDRLGVWRIRAIRQKVLERSSAQPARPTCML